MNRINDLRKERKMTIQELADLSEVAFSTLNYWLIGKRNPSQDSVYTLASIFCVTVEYLMGKSDLGYYVNWKNGREIMTSEEFHKLSSENKIALINGCYYMDDKTAFARIAPLMEKTESQEQSIPEDIDINSIEFALYDEVKELTEEQKQYILEMARLARKLNGN